MSIQSKATNGEPWKTTATYRYVDVGNKQLYFVERGDPKDFRQYRIDATGKRIWNLEGVDRVPYRLPELLAGVEGGEVIIVVEGEKDVDNLSDIGFCATTNAGGAGWKWTEEFMQHFNGGSVIVVADNDEPGRKAARDRAEGLLDVARAVRIIENLPDVAEKGDASDLISQGWDRDRFVELFRFATLVEAPPIEDPGALLGDVERFIRRFVVVDKEANLAMALWVLHTHAIEAADATPYLNIGSPQRRCGKSRALEVMKLLVKEPFYTARTSAAALVRKVAKDSCILLLDESDTAFNAGQEYTEALRGILNAGSVRGGVATLCQGRDHEVKDFSVFGPKAIAGIGELPDTVTDRSIRIELSRKLPGEFAERFRLRNVRKEADLLRSRIEQWAKRAVEALIGAEPDLPSELSDRAQDGWEPLLAIADACGAGDRARGSAVCLFGTTPESEDVSERTLLDCKIVFDALAVDRLPTLQLIAELRKIEDGPYANTRFGGEFDARSLAKRLRPYAIKRTDIRIGEHTYKGYYRFDFEDAWMRYGSSLPLAA